MKDEAFKEGRTGVRRIKGPEIFGETSPRSPLLGTSKL
jgi:hypothetical protein